MKITIVTFLLFLVFVAVRGCTFPSFVQNPTDQPHEEWRYKDTQEGIVNPLYSAYNVRIVAGNLTANSIVSEAAIFKHKSFHWRCIEEQETGKFVVYNTGERKEYLCVSFEKRSESVVQLKRSKPVTLLRDISCSEKDLNLDPWPLMKNVYSSIECPFLGGFWVDYYDYVNDFLCGKTRMNPTRMEFACTEGEGIYVNFDGCSHVRESLITTMNVDKGHIQCRAVWTHNDFTFIVASDQALNWILRYRASHIKKQELDILIMKDAVAETKVRPQISRNYIKARLFKENMNSLCLDYRPEPFCERVDCTSKDSSSYCHKYCHGCQQSDRMFCKFEPEMQGEWLSVKRDHQVEKVEINDRWLNFTDYESLRCFKTKHKRNNTRLVKLSDNGCSPRYFCLKTSFKSKSVLEYQIGRPLGWITKEREICSKKQFAHNQDPASWKHFTHTEITKPLVRKDHVQPTSCNLFYMVDIMADVNDGIYCNMRVKPDDASTLKFKYSNCSDGKSRGDETYTCLFSSTSGTELQNDFHVLLVAMKGVTSSQSVCIAIYKNKEDYKFIMIPSGECFINSDRFYNLKYDPKGKEYLHWPVNDVIKLTKVKKDITKMTTVKSTVTTPKKTTKVSKKPETVKPVKTSGGYKVNKNPENSSTNVKYSFFVFMCVFINSYCMISV